MKKLLFYGRIAAQAIIFLVLPTIALVSCFESPLEPVGPSFNSQLAIPILNRSYLSTRIIDDPANIGYNPDGTFSYVNTYELEKRSLDSLTAYPKPDSDKTELGRFIVSSFSTPPTIYTALDLGLTIGGPAQIVLPTSFPIDTNHLDNRNQFDYVGVYSGTLTFTITNNLPIPIDFPNPIILRNNWSSPINNDVAATFVINDTIMPGSSRSPSSNLTGVLLYGVMAIDPFEIHTPGSSGTVTFSSSNSIAFSFQSTSLSADSAFAIIPNQTIYSDESSRFIVDDSITIKRATFKRGNLKIEINNNIDLITVSHLQIEELKENSTDNVFTKDYTFNGANDRMDTTLSIADYYIESDKDTLGTALNYSARIQIIDSRRVKKRVSKNDFIQAKVTASDTLYAQSITGNFPTRYVDVYAGTKSDLSVEDTSDINADSIIFKDIKLKVRLPMSGGGTTLPQINYKNLTLIAKNTNLSQIDSVTIPDGSIYPTPSITPEIDFTTASGFDNFTRSLQRGFPNLPDSFFVRGYLEVNPDFINHTNARYTIQDTSGVYPLIDIDVPSIFKIANGIISDTQEIEGNLEDNIARSVINGTLSLTFTNGIPIQMTSNIGFLKWDDSTRQSQTVKSFGPLGPIAAAHTGDDSSAVDSVDSNIRIGLSGDDLRMINNADSVYIQLYMNTRNGTTNGGMIKLRSTDAVMVRASTIVRFIVNKP
jgi:hypothetical protein